MNIFSTTFKSFAIVSLLSGVNCFAMDKPLVVNAPAVVTWPRSSAISVTPAIVTIEPIAPVQIVPEIRKKECSIACAVTKKWNAAKTELARKKTDLVTYAKGMKARGWNGWTNKEKAGVVIGGTVLVAAATYAVYKLYQSLTAPHIKVRSGVRVTRA